MNPSIIKKIIIICLIWSSFSNSQAQGTFQKTYGGSGMDIGETLTITADGTYMVAGHTTSFGAGGADAFVSQLDACGNLVWSKAYGGGATDNAQAGIRQTTDGNFVFYGYTTSFGNGGEDGYLTKISPSGTVLWAKTYGGFTEDYGRCVQVANDGGFVLANTTQSFGLGARDIHFIKTDNNGTVQWSNTYGSYQNDNPHHIVPTTDNGYLILGTTFVGHHNALLLKIDNLGTMQWAFDYGGTGKDSARDGIQTADGGFLLVGFSESFGSSREIYLFKVDARGNLQWSKVCRSTDINIFSTTGVKVAQSADGDYLMAAYTQGNQNSTDITITNLSDAGIVRWAYSYGGTGLETLPDFSEGMQLMEDGSIVMVGTQNNFDATGEDIFLMKTDAMGNAPVCNRSLVRWELVDVNTFTNTTNITSLPQTVIAEDAALTETEVFFTEEEVCSTTTNELTFTATRACNSPSIQLAVDNPNSNSIYNYWIDLNNNGVQDANIDLFAAGATVDIYPPSGNNNYTIYLNYNSGCDAATAQLSIPNDLITFDELGVTTAYVGTDNVGIPALNCEEYEILVDEGSAPYNYSWDTDGYVRHAIIETGLINVCAGASATWAVTITDVNGCSFVVDSGNLGDDTLNELAITNHFIMQANCRLKTGQISIEVAGGQVPYQYAWAGPANWLNQNNNASSIQNIPTGWYTVTVTDSNTPPESVVQEYWVPCRTDRFKQIHTPYLTISPNPAHKEINLQFMTEQSGAGELSIYDITGKKIKTILRQKLKADMNYTITQSLENLSRGVYYVQFLLNNHTVVQQKLLKVK